MTLPLNTSANPNDPIAQARYNMIEQQIRPWNVLDPVVLETLDEVHREYFVPSGFRGMAFMDIEIPLRGNAEVAVRKGECMLAPRVEARMLQDLQIQPSDRVLEIGTGSGYMAALLAHRARQVLSLEIDAELAATAQENLRQAGIKGVEVRQADGSGDLSDLGTFDVIVLSGSVASVPQALLQQLNDGGRFAAIVGDEPIMRFTLVRREGDRFRTTTPWDVNVSRLHGFAEPSQFRF